MPYPSIYSNKIPWFIISLCPVEFYMNFNIDSPELDQHPELRGYAAAYLYNQDLEKYQTIIDSWLYSDKMSHRKAGVIAAGGSGDRSYITKLKQMLDDDLNSPIFHYIFEGLHKLEAPDLNSLAPKFLSHPTRC